MELPLHFRPPPEQKPFRLNLNVILMCPECKDNNIVEDFAAGDMICGDCGLVLGDRIVDIRSEWRTFADNDSGPNPCRVGEAANPFLSGSQLDTVVSPRDRYSGESKTLARIQTRMTSKPDVKLLGIYKDMDAMSECIGLPRAVFDIAKQVYKKIEDLNALKKKMTTRSIMAACIFIACRKGQVPRTFKEICALTKVPKNDICKAYKAIEKALFGEAQKDHMVNAGETAARHANDMPYTPTATTNASDLMIRFCNRLKLSRTIEAMCAVFVSSIAAAGILDGRSPTTTAAAGIYFITHFMGNGKSIRDVAEATGLSEGTIKHAYKVLYASRKELVNPEWQRGYKGSLEMLPS
jgi:transcription initiation factor TFIIB